MTEQSSIHLALLLSVFLVEAWLGKKRPMNAGSTLELMAVLALVVFKLFYRIK